jgi:hypothetical protein
MIQSCFPSLNPNICIANIKIDFKITVYRLSDPGFIFPNRYLAITTLVANLPALIT